MHLQVQNNSYIVFNSGNPIGDGFYDLSLDIYVSIALYIVKKKVFRAKLKLRKDIFSTYIKTFSYKRCTHKALGVDIIVHNKCTYIMYRRL